MAKIQRQTQKIFAGNAPADDIAVFGSFKTGTPVYTDNIEVLQSAAYESGWSSAIVANEAPFMEELNGIQYGFSQQIAYNLQEGIAEYDPNTTYYKGSIVKALNSEEIPVLYYSLIDENVGNALDSENWAVLSVGGGGGTGSAGLNMFDTVLKDHILTFEESKGLALQGTYVYKDAVAGSRYGYPDFYNECVAQKNAATLKQIDYVQPTNPAGITSTGAWANVMNAFDNNSSTYATCNNTTDYIEWDLGQTLFIKGFTANGEWVNAVSHATNYALYSVDSDGNETLLGVGTGAASTTSYTSTANFDGVFATKLRIKMDESAAQYPSRLVQFTLNASTDLLYENENGHIFYDIANKAAIDEIYNNTGTAWYYGVDTANERIFLPRNKWFAIIGCSDAPVIGNDHALTFVDGSGVEQSMMKDCGDNKYALAKSPTVGSVGTGGARWTANTGGILGLTTDPDKSGLTADLSNALKPDTNKYLYMVVGNTEVTSSITDVTEITTSENDTIPLFTAQYFDFTPNNASWLKAGQQTNRGGIYTTAYNTLVNCLTDNTYNLKVVEAADMTADVDYSEYWKVDQDNMTFTTPTKVSFIETTSQSAQLYFKVANAVENLELLDAGEVLEAVADKVSLTNTQWATDACMPDYSAGVDITSPFTAPCDGYLYLQTYNGMQRWKLSNNTIDTFYTAQGNSTISGASWSILQSGTTIIKDYSANSDVAKFFPLKGANND